MDFAGKTAVITGGTSGIGAAAARALAAAGARTFVGARSTPGDDLLESPGIHFVATDVSIADEVAQLVDRAADAGQLDFAINCAGYEGLFRPIDDYPDDDCRRILDTNLVGTYYSVKHEVRRMRAQKRGAIVNLASIAGLTGIPLAGPYAASKHAVIGLTRSVALEVIRDGIRVNAVAPSLVDTPMATRLAEKTGNDIDDIAMPNPMQRAATTDEVVATILWLLSDAASFVTGQTISVDGGQSVA